MIASLNVLKTIVTYWFIIIVFLTLCLNIAWLIKLIIVCSRQYKQYKQSKQVNKNTESYSATRLYNQKTHLVKYILLIACCAVEVCSWVFVSLTAGIQYGFAREINKTVLAELGFNSSCIPSRYILEFDLHPGLILVKNINYLIFFLLFILLSFLARFIAKRYLVHPYRNSIFHYAAWYISQCVIVFIVSTKYTVIFSFVVIPILGLSNWILLLRDNLRLSRVLKSDLRATRIHSYRSYLHLRYQYRFYRTFSVVMLISMFLLMFAASIQLFSNLLEFVFQEPCVLSLFYSSNTNIHLPTFLTIASHNIMDVIDGIGLVSTMLGVIPLTVPLWAITLVPIIIKFIKLLKDREENYRFNYDKLQPLMRKRRIVML